MSMFQQQQLFLVLAFFLVKTFGQDAACQAWLDTPEGTEFFDCDSNFPGLPMRTPDNNCILTLENDFNTLCNDTCYATLVEGYSFILENGTCLSFYENIFGACATDDDCIGTGFGNRTCLEGVCYTSCNETADCNYCNLEICEPLGQAMVCQSNLTETIGNAASTFKDNVYMLQAACVTNDAGDYCSLLLADYLNENLTSTNCSSFEDWGCCLGTMLASMEFCQSQRFLDAAIYQCSGSNLTCTSLPEAQEFCASTNGTNGTESSSSTGMTGISGSSGMTGINGSSDMTGMTGSSDLTGMTGINGSSGITGSSSGMTGSSGFGGTGGNATDSAAEITTISWSVLLGLLFITPILS